MPALLLPVFDKYASYIWGAYGVTALVLIGLLLVCLRLNRKTREELAALDRQREQQGGL